MTTTSAASSISSDMYLQLLMTQLQNQNPLDPMDPTEFTNQLVSYSTLEQQIQSNEKLDTLSTQLNWLATSSALSYLGSVAELDSATAPYQSGEASWSYTLDSEAKSVTLTVTDASGNVVYSGNGAADAGAHDFTLSNDDLLQAVSNGDALTLTVTASTTTGASVASSITAYATIDSFESDSDGGAYQAGDLSFTTDDILKLYDAAAL